MGIIAQAARRHVKAHLGQIIQEGRVVVTELCLQDIATRVAVQDDVVDVRRGGAFRDVNVTRRGGGRGAGLPGLLVAHLELGDLGQRDDQHGAGDHVERQGQRGGILQLFERPPQRQRQGQQPHGQEKHMPAQQETAEVDIFHGGVEVPIGVEPGQPDRGQDGGTLPIPAHQAQQQEEHRLPRRRRLPGRAGPRWA